MSVLSTVPFKPPDRSYFVNIVISQKSFSEMEARVWIGVTVVLLRALWEWLWFCQSAEQLCLRGGGRQTHSASWHWLCQRDSGAFQFAKNPHFLCLCFESLALRIEKGGKIWVSYGMHVKYTCPSQLSANAASLLSFQLQELVQDEQYLQNWQWKQQ